MDVIVYKKVKHTTKLKPSKRCIVSRKATKKTDALTKCKQLEKEFYDALYKFRKAECDLFLRLCKERVKFN